MTEIEPHEHPDFADGYKWTAAEIKWIEERIAQTIETCAQICDGQATVEGIAQRCASYIRGLK